MKTAQRIIVSIFFVMLSLQGGLAVAEENQTVTLKIPPIAQQAALAYWNHDAIANAKPFPIPKAYGTPVKGVAIEEWQAEPAEPGFSPAGAPDPAAVKLAQTVYAEDWKAASLAAPAADLPAGTSQVYTSSYSNYWTPAQTAPPNRWVGRLSFSAGYCSATAISNNHFVTAAHCVYDTIANRWYSNWVFTPAYRNGSAPYGSFPATSCTILTAWINLYGGYSINTWAKYDVAVCGVGNNSAGKSLNSMVGWAGRQWNYGYVNNIMNMGYPWKDYNDTAITNAGAYLRQCAAETFQQAADVMGSGCNWGGGISGGPWFRYYALGYPANGYVDSVNSGLFVGTQNLYGIRFNSSNIVPICTTQGC
jgi:V8-like Glu-specific endopeptidase